MRLDPTVTFLAGLISTLAGVFFFRFWSVAQGSDTYFRVTATEDQKTDEVPLLSRNDRHVVVGNVSDYPPWELPPLLHRLAYVGVFLCLSLLSFDNRTADLLHAAPDRLDPAVTQYCADPNEEEQIVQDDPGCKLIQRAFELGYTKDLGDCAPKVKKQGANGVCTLRRKDEPYLHYTWRLLRGKDLIDEEENEENIVSRLMSRLRLQWEYVPTLASLQWTAVAARPRSSHHIWTNLPPPERGFFFKVSRFFHPRGCLDASSQPQETLGDPTWRANSSELLAHAIAQLVYTPQYKPSVGFCPEYHVHWDTASNFCTKLLRAPEDMLSSSDLELIEGVLARQQNDTGVSELGKALKDANALQSRSDIARSRESEARPASSKQSIVSFQCFFVVENGNSEVTTRDFTLNGTTFSAREVRIPRTATPPEVYKNVATLLAPGFRYGQLLSDEAAEADMIDQRQLTQSDYPLAQLEVLRDADVFVGNEWLQEQTNLLSVYPAHQHLENLVTLFRRQYAVQRGRL